jgi:hypothetical protein
MKKVLIPHKISYKCSLYEALYWVGFKIYPLSNITDNDCDIREDSEYNDDININLDNYVYDSFFTEAICKKYGLPKNYLSEYIENNNSYPHKSFSLEEINKGLA